MDYSAYCLLAINDGTFAHSDPSVAVSSHRICSSNSPLNPHCPWHTRGEYSMHRPRLMYQAFWASLFPFSAKPCLPVRPARSISPVLAAQVIYVVPAQQLSLQLPSKEHPCQMCPKCLNAQAPQCFRHPQQQHDQHDLESVLLGAPTRAFHHAKLRLQQRRCPEPL